MKIFISWSGALSESVALVLRVWLRNVIQVIDPYVSSEDIEKGSRWFSDIDNKLDNSDFGIICLTRDNLTRPWILFEAGAISRNIDRARVTPLLIDLTPADLNGPLAEFQATTLKEADMLRLVQDIGNHLNDPHYDSGLIERSFRKWWPDLEKAILEIKESNEKNAATILKRPDREILEELLQTTRNLAHLILKTSNKAPEITSMVQRFQIELEKRRKIFLSTVLDAASKVTLEDDELQVEFSPNDKHFRDTLAKPENLKVVQEIGSEILGRPIAIRIKIADADTEDNLHHSATITPEEKRRLMELAEKSDLVQRMLKTFRGKIVDVRRVEN